MAHNRGIICFRHCSSNSIFCKSVPEECPICHSCITSYALQPFLIPYPYTNAAHQPTTIVIRPSQGIFTDYNITSDLHIGIVDSAGMVFEFDKEGLIKNDFLKWMDCISYKVVPSSWDCHWDETLGLMLKDDKWKFWNYDEREMNCFNFVLEFLNYLNYTSMRFTSKEDVCDRLLVDKIQEAIKYNFLYKHLENNQYFISE